MKTRRNSKRTLRGGDPAIIGIVLGSVLAVGIGAMMYRHMPTLRDHYRRKDLGIESGK